MRSFLGLQPSIGLNFWHSIESSLGSSPRERCGHMSDRAYCGGLGVGTGSSDSGRRSSLNTDLHPRPCLQPCLMCTTERLRWVKEGSKSVPSMGKLLYKALHGKAPPRGPLTLSYNFLTEKVLVLAEPSHRPPCMVKWMNGEAVTTECL